MMTIRYVKRGVWVVILALLGVSAQAADVNWANSGSDWETGGNWGGSVPGVGDVAVFPNANIAAQPSLAGAVSVNALKIPGGNDFTGNWTINGSGTLTIKGTPGSDGYGINLYLSGGGWWYGIDSIIYPNLLLDGAQKWFGQDTRNLYLYGTLGGSGPLAIQGATGSGQWYYGHKHTINYRGPSDPTFTGGLVISNALLSVDLAGQASDRNVQFGTGAITLKSAPGFDDTLRGQVGEFQFWTANTAASLVTLTLTNSLVVDASGGFLNSYQQGTSPYTRNVFAGPVAWNGPLRMNVRAQGTAASSTRFTGPMTVNAAGAGTPGLFPGYNALYHNWFLPGYSEINYIPLDLDGTIADGAGPFRNPVVFRSRLQRTMTVSGAANSYAGGTVIEQCGSSGYAMYRCAISVATGGKLGAGDVAVLPGGRLQLAEAANLASGAKLHLQSTPTALGVVALQYNGIPALGASADGVLALDNDSFTTAVDQSTLGNGKMFLGSYGWHACGITSLQPGTDRVYRLGGGWDKQYDAPYLETSASLSLADVGGVTSLQVGRAAYNGGGTVWLKGNNSFSGDITVSGPLDYSWLDGSSLIGNARTTAGQSPFGAAAGNVHLQLGTLGVNAVGGANEKVSKNRLTFEGVSQVRLDAGGGGILTRLEFDSLARTNHGALVFNAVRNSAAVNERFTVTNGAPVMSNGMVAPYFISYNQVDWTYHFSTYGANGFGKFSGYVTMPSPGTGTEVVNYSGAVAGTPSIWALRATGGLSGAGPITIHGGGMITTHGYLGAIEPAIDFGAAEGVIFSESSANNPTVFSGKVSGSGGLSVLGGAVSLKNINNDFTGLITVSGGWGGAVLRLENTTDGDTSKVLGNADNDILLNGGALLNYASWLSSTWPSPPARSRWGRWAAS